MSIAHDYPEDWTEQLDAWEAAAELLRDEANRDLVDDLDREARSEREQHDEPFADCCERVTVHWHIPPARREAHQDLVYDLDREYRSES